MSFKMYFLFCLFSWHQKKLLQHSKYKHSFLNPAEHQGSLTTVDLCFLQKRHKFCSWSLSHPEVDGSHAKHKHTHAHTHLCFTILKFMQLVHVMSTSKFNPTTLLYINKKCCFCQKAVSPMKTSHVCPSSNKLFISLWGQDLKKHSHIHT